MEQARTAVAAATTTEEIREVAAAVTGKKSALAQAGRRLGSLEPEERKELGRELHEARATVEALIEARRTEIARAELARETGREPDRPHRVHPGIGGRRRRPVAT